MDRKTFHILLSEFAYCTFKCIVQDREHSSEFSSVGGNYTLSVDLQNSTVRLLELCKNLPANRAEVMELGKRIEIYIDSLSSSLGGDLAHNARRKLHQVLAAVKEN